MQHSSWSWQIPYTIPYLSKIFVWASSEALFLSITSQKCILLIPDAGIACFKIAHIKHVIFCGFHIFQNESLWIIMNRMENSKNRIVGGMKEATGKVLDLEELELKGKLQTMKSEAGDKLEDIKDGVYEKANGLFNKMRDRDGKNS